MERSCQTVAWCGLARSTAGTGCSGLPDIHETEAAPGFRFSGIAAI
jgi:hypothetical protein